MAYWVLLNDSEADSRFLDRLYIFIHIPRSGGTTFYRILENVYSGVPGCSTRYYKEEQVPEADRLRVEMIGGHVIYDFHFNWPKGTKHSYFTFLRDPVERVVSAYHYARSNEDNWEHRLCMENPLEEYAAKTMDNYQTRALAGFNYTNSLKAAKRHLEKEFCMAGITERFDESLEILGKALHWKTIPEYERVNQAPGRPELAELPSRTLELIRDRNRNDLELYAFANRLLDRQLSKSGSKIR